MRGDSKIVGNAAVPADAKRVVARIVVRETAFLDRRGRGIKLPTQANVGGELRSEEPFVLNEGEELPGAVVGEEGREVTARLARNVEEEAGKGIEKAGLSRAGASVHCRLTIVKCVNTPRAEGLFLEHSVTDAAEVRTELHRVIAHDFGPRVCEVDVGFRANPGQARGESDDGIRKNAAVDLDADDSAGDCLVEVNARNAKRF